MPKIVKLQMIGDEVGIILPVSFFHEGQSVQILDGFELLALQRKYEEAGAADERARLNVEERQQEVHRELVAELSTACDLLRDLTDPHAATNVKVRKFLASQEGDDD
jgi:hypothetical protein